MGGKSLSDGLPSLTKNSMKKTTLHFNPNVVKTYLEDGIYYKGDKGSYYLEDDVEVKDNIIINEFSLTGRVIWGQEYLDDQISKGTEIIIKNESFVPYTKKSEPTIQSPNKIIPKDKVGDVLKANAERDALFEDKIFDYPKPTSLIKYLLSYIDDKDYYVLDFFSGSATSADSVLRLNLEDGGTRKFIMVQIPEQSDENSKAFKEGYETICEIGKERIKRAGDQIIKESNNDNLDIGFKVFKLDSSNLEKWDPDYNNIQQSLTVDQIKKDRTNEDLIYEVMLKYGINLTYPIEQENNIYSIGFGALVICLEDNITKDIVDEILNFTNDSSTSRVVFKDSGFKSDANKTNIKEILKTNHIDEFITI